MENKPFLMNFKMPAPVGDPSWLDEEFVYSREEQVNQTANGGIVWRMTHSQTGYHTAAHYNPEHRTATGTRKAGSYKRMRRDKRIGK